MTDLRERLRAVERELQKRIGKRDAIVEAIARDEAKASEHEALVEAIDKASEVILAATETRRQQLRDRVENLVTRGLRAVFGRDDYEFLFQLSITRGNFGVVPVLKSGFGEREMEVEIADGHGGGVVDVVAFLLRLIVLSLARPKVAPVLVLDEAFKHVSPEYLRGVASLLRELNGSAGVQFLLVTHKPELLDAADVIYRARLEGGETTFDLEHDLRDEAFHQAPTRGSTARDRSSAWDHEDLGAAPPLHGVEERDSETVDALAVRQRTRASKAKRRRKRKTKP